jgi:uridine kinase
MPRRNEVLCSIADTILRLPAAPVARVGIDGVDGAGKSMFGDELAALLAASGRAIIRASVDAFHNPRALRYRLGRDSPLGYFRDSYDYDKLKAVLLDPLSPGGGGNYRTAIFDYRIDSPVVAPLAHVESNSILVFDGIFLHRQELRHYWDYSIFLDVSFDISIARGAQHDGGSPDPRAPENRRYVEGQQIYLRECDPKRYASIVINNDVLVSPVIERGAKT